MKSKLTKQKLNAVSPDRSQLLSSPIWVRYFIWTIVLVGMLLVFWAMYLTAERVGSANRLMVQGWGEYGALIVHNKINAIWHAAIMMAVIAGFMTLHLLTGATWQRWKKISAWLLVLLVAGDAFWLARHYVKTMPLSALAENDIVRILQNDQSNQRVALVAQDGFYNFWLTYLFPYHGIRAVNVTQMPRMPNDYKRFLESVARHPLRFWQLMAVNYVLAPAPFWTHIKDDPNMRDHFELAYAYNVTPDPDGMSVSLIPGSAEQPGQHAVIRLKAVAPYCALMTGWRVVDDVQALQLLTATNFPLYNQVLVAPEWESDLPASHATGMTGLVQRVAYRPGYMRFHVSAPETGILRIAEKYDAAWRAWVDDEPAPVRRVDYIFQGVLLESGLHEVALKYAPSRRLLGLQLIVVLACLIAAGYFLLPDRPVAVKSPSLNKEAP